jgi:guanosine-3',5'-bis(diphosphate) 3'-pyrophosphohydrolase
MANQEKPIQRPPTYSEHEISMMLKAFHFSAQKHRYQRRKDPDESPYINHPIEVAETLWMIGGVRDLMTVIGAILHDTLEDTDTSVGEIETVFGKEIGRLVDEVTDQKKLPKAARKQTQIRNAPHKSVRAKQLKLADLSCNVYDILTAPPQGWSNERCRDYLVWTSKVVEGLRGTNQNLETHYDRLLKKAFKKLHEQ